jgi:hypothetical protein
MGAELFISPAVIWQDLADDLLFAIDQLEAISHTAKGTPIHQTILIAVADDLQSLRFCWCSPEGSEAGIDDQALRMSLQLLPTDVEIARDDEATVPNASIDRAISKAAAEMLSWTKDPENFELLEQRRYQLFLQWPGGMPALVDEYAYGLWDE